MSPVDYGQAGGKRVPFSATKTHLIDIDLEQVHAGVAHFVVSSVHKNLVKDLVKAGHKLDSPVDHLLPVMHPHLLLLPVCAANVSVWAQQHVIQLRQLLIAAHGAKSMWLSISYEHHA